ncbi:dienelactone hydrolase family protein [Streptacidiphilus sp. MAP5-3]|uniref:dienelactone hydrolase family protein n=1 Tax=unclassified Streptacidiphilus TaxID=2643834 RepID=UPI003511315D
MSHQVDWGEEHRTSEHATERSFVIRRGSSPVPGTVWTPVGHSGPVPLVLLGHGGSGHRRSERILTTAERVTRSGHAAVAIDGPHHGDRVPSPLVAAEYQALIAAEGVERVLDRMADDWVAARDLLVRTGLADPGRQAYVGLSMATRFGLAAAVGLGGSLKCAVFGKFGVQASPDLDPGLQAPDRALQDAARITAPVLFHLQRDDGLFPRQGQLDLFDAFASPDKELHAFPGAHGHTPPHAPDLRHAFLDRHLGCR